MTKRSAFDPSLADLPTELPIFPLPGAVVFPGQVLPLNIFEPRYLNMVLDALGAARMIGMIQPLGAMDVEPVPVHAIGCGARITAFQETRDGRLLLNLTGVCRFVVDEELDLCRGYRRIRPDWVTYGSDLEESPPAGLGLSDLEPALRAYFSARKLEPSWDALASLDSSQVVDFLSMTLPFDPPTKQLLVEAMDVDARGHLLLSALSEAVVDSGGGDTTRH